LSRRIRDQCRPPSSRPALRINKPGQVLSAALFLAFLFLVAPPPGAGAFVEHVVDGDGRFLLLDCGGSGSSGTASNSKNDSGANLAHLLAALPSVAAPEGSAVLSRGGASLRGVCIGNDSSPEDCHACLAAAARNITGVCSGPTGRRGGAWSGWCFLAYYADASAARDDDRRKVLCDGDVPSSYLDDGDRGQLANYYYYYYTLPDLSFAWLAWTWRGSPRTSRRGRSPWGRGGACTTPAGRCAPWRSARGTARRPRTASGGSWGRRGRRRSPAGAPGQGGSAAGGCSATAATCGSR
jgi:hypothetical protein